jgi:protein ImuB
VLVTTTRGRRIVVAACDGARAAGARPGLTLAEAQALCPGLVHADHDADRDARGLAALGRWLMRFTPAVAVEPPAAIFLDVTGCDRLFGGFDAILQQATAAIATLGLSADLAIAPTPGAAWALARTGRVVTEAEVASALAPLPPAALRIDPATADALRTVGIDTITQLMALPRDLLPARFGRDLLMRLDQATGRLPEPLVLLAPPAPVAAAMAFDGAVQSLEPIWIVLRELLGRVAVDLNRRGCGATSLRVTFRCEGEPPVVRDVQLCRPTRDVTTLFGLLRCATEDARARDGFTAVELAVPALERVADAQARLIGRDPHDAAVETARLVERLRVRWSHGAVGAVAGVESHLPERAWTTVAPLSSRLAGPGGRGARGAVAAPLNGDDDDGVIRAASVPLHLLPTPAEVRAIVLPSEDDCNARPAAITIGGTMQGLAHAAGPHRVAGVWWTGHDKTRDYFDVVDHAGRRFWVFRALPSRRWFLHGAFA